MTWIINARYEAGVPTVLEVEMGLVSDVQEEGSWMIDLYLYDVSSAWLVPKALNVEVNDIWVLRHSSTPLGQMVQVRVES